MNCCPSGKYVHLLYMYSILGRSIFCFNYWLSSAWHGGDQFVALLRWYGGDQFVALLRWYGGDQFVALLRWCGSPGFFDSGLQLICVFWSLVSHFPLD